MKTITMRCRAFAGYGVAVHKVAVDCRGVVRVWDPVAGHYTTCHSMSASAMKRARQRAH
jgi:hypothetical protein